MSSRFLRFFVFLVAGTLGTLNAQQQPAQRALSDWARVQQIQPKQKVKVSLSSGKTLSGRFVEADAEGIALLQGGKQTTKIPREEILLISKKSAKAKGALIGLAAGAGSMAIATASSPGDLGRGRAAALGGIPGGAIGAGLGAIIGALVRPATTIYETAPPPRSK